LVLGKLEEFLQAQQVQHCKYALVVVDRWLNQNILLVSRSTTYAHCNTEWVITAFFADSLKLSLQTKQTTTHIRKFELNRSDEFYTNTLS
jgi:hypothetical protein